MPAASRKTAAKARTAPAARRASAPAAQAAATPVKPAKAAAVPARPVQPAPPPAKRAEPAKADKPRKLKILRDSFTIPKTEYAVLEALKQRAMNAGRPAKKSEVLRAGVKALAGMGDADFMAALGAVPAVKTGRPAKG